MSISVHMISVPAEEVVSSRVTYLPESGGSLGRSPSCDIALPDQTKWISRTHCQLYPTDRGYVIKDISNNGVSLNDKSLAKEKEYVITDGDIIKLGAIQLNIFGEYHSSVASVYNDLAYVLYHQHKTTEALRICRRYLAVQLNLNRKDDSSIADIY